MQGTAVTSVRLSTPLRNQLDQEAHRRNRRQNWIISEALKKYLGKDDEDAVIAQMREESLLVAKLEQDPEIWDQELWERNIDTTGWEWE